MPNNLTSQKGSIAMRLLLLLVFIMLATGGFLYYRHVRQQKSEQLEARLPAIKINLKNGCGIEGAATEMSEFLSSRNVDIVATGNAEKFIYDTTIIVVKKMDAQDLQRLIHITGIQHWTLAENEFAQAPFEIIIGKDYEKLIAGKENEQE
jgi:uncharacterized protein HemX